MFKNKTVNTILGILLSMFLIFLLCLEFKVFFNMLGKYQKSAIQRMAEMTTNAATERGRDKVKTVYTWPTAPDVDDNMNVIKLHDTDENVRVNGILSTFDPDYSNSYTYTHVDEQTPNKVYITEKPGYEDLYAEAYAAFVSGDATSMASLVDYNITDTSVIYQQNYAEGAVPVIWDEEIKQFYIIYTKNDGTVFVVNCNEPCELTKDIATVNYGDATKNPQLSHTYSDYELWAANNTLEELKDSNKKSDGDDKDKDIKESYTNNDNGAANNYVSNIDNDKRKQMADYATLSWKEDGTSTTNADVKLDITGSEAKKSQWTLTSTTYSYTYAGLTLSKMSAKRNSTMFSLTCNVNNNVDAERPYVVIVKYLDKDGHLIGVKVVDKRATPLASKGVDTVSVDINNIEDKCAIENITAVQFDIY